MNIRDQLCLDLEPSYHNWNALTYNQNDGFNETKKAEAECTKKNISDDQESERELSQHLERSLLLEVPSPNPILRKRQEVTIMRFSDLSQESQMAALKVVKAINRVTSTQPGITWAPYTEMIEERLLWCKNAKNTFFVAKVQDQFVGYVAFYTKEDRLPQLNPYLNHASEAYCSWTAVDERFRGQGIAEKLKLQIFNDPKIKCFKGHIKKTNEASLRVLQKFGERGYPFSTEDAYHQVYYTVQRNR